MNKQQLAQRIWASANQMRSKIEANEYKDFILGFIFYKYLSEKEIEFLREYDFDDEAMKELVEDDEETVELVQNNIGYFIPYKHLYSTWLAMGTDFTVGCVTDALSSFTRLISPNHARLFKDIFKTLETGLSKLGDSAGSRTKAIRRLLRLIKDIPMDGKQGYDVLGYIYEYLIGQFASNAGKKAGEFYTPHEVSLLMSELVASHLKDEKEIKIYDPTSGSGSLLINIGKSIAKYKADASHIKYFAQELKENTYNLTRMNLVMRGIKPDNIAARNADTLEDDWPLSEKNNFDPLRVDAVVSNPPYSQAWDPAGKESDPRYAPFGLAPKSKADYAFLLHDLYHLKPHGIMTIVLPHGVLFRGGEEETIRRNLIEGNHIDAIIGLPANIFYGTGIPTIIMVLKQTRERNDVLIIDASKGFIKEGKNNKLRSSDIKRIADTFVSRESAAKFSRVVTREEIRANGYNLNIPRYVDSAEEAEHWDIYASLFGGIPTAELAALSAYWDAFPRLRGALFTEDGTPYAALAVDAAELKEIIGAHPDAAAYMERYRKSLETLPARLQSLLIENPEQVEIAKAEDLLAQDIFQRLGNIPLVDKYEAYQLLDDQWTTIASDLEMIQTEGFDCTKKVDPRLIPKKKEKNGDAEEDDEVQDGWMGHIFPFPLVQEKLLAGDVAALRTLENRLSAISGEMEELIDNLSEEDKENLLSDDNTAFAAKNVNAAMKKLWDNVTTPEIQTLEAYLLLTKANDKLTFIEAHPEIHWDAMTAAKNGTYGKKEINASIKEARCRVTFAVGSYEDTVLRAGKLLLEEQELKKEIKDKTEVLDDKTRETIEHLTDDEAKALLYAKWGEPLVDGIARMPAGALDTLTAKLKSLQEKYAVTFLDMEQECAATEKALAALLDDLTGSEYDKKGLSELQALLMGEHHGA